MLHVMQVCCWWLGSHRSAMSHFGRAIGDAFLELTRSSAMSHLGRTVGDVFPELTRSNSWHQMALQLCTFSF